MKKSFKIFGHIYTVKYIKEWHDDDAAGKIDTHKLEILIDANQPKSKQTEVLFHEILEAIDFHLELELAHSKICGLSEVFYMILKQNRMLR